MNIKEIIGLLEDLENQANEGCSAMADEISAFEDQIRDKQNEIEDLESEVASLESELETATDRQSAFEEAASYINEAISQLQSAQEYDDDHNLDLDAYVAQAKTKVAEKNVFHVEVGTVPEEFTAPTAPGVRTKVIWK